MSLIKFPDCAHDLSDLAASRLYCNRPMQPDQITTQLTSKPFKNQLLYSAFAHFPLFILILFHNI